MATAKKYTFIVGDNLMYNATHVRRVRWFNKLWIKSGLVNVLEYSVIDWSEKSAKGFALMFFANQGRIPHIMGFKL